MVRQPTPVWNDRDLTLEVALPGGDTAEVQEWVENQIVSLGRGWGLWGQAGLLRGSVGCAHAWAVSNHTHPQGHIPTPTLTPPPPRGLQVTFTLYDYEGHGVVPHTEWLGSAAIPLATVLAADNPGSPLTLLLTLKSASVVPVCTWVLVCVFLVCVCGAPGQPSGAWHTVAGVFQCVEIVTQGV